MYSLPARLVLKGVSLMIPVSTSLHSLPEGNLIQRVRIQTLWTGVGFRNGDMKYQVRQLFHTIFLLVLCSLF